MTKLVYFSLTIVLFINSASCKRIFLTCAHKRAFVDGHNSRRFQVARGIVPRQPFASNMKYMVWDEELAEKAAGWADVGIFGHNPVHSIGSKRWHPIGENVYVTRFHTNIPGVYADVTPNIMEALDAWFLEHRDYTFAPYAPGSIKQIGHYTQMVWADSTRVGCGISQRRENLWTTSTLFVCNYGPTGNYIGKHPYDTRARGFLQCAKGEFCNKLYGSYC